MAITTNTYYDPNRDMYYDRQQREMQHQYEMARQQQMYGGSHLQYAQQQLTGGQPPVEVVDPNDPLAFMKKADKTILLTGEA